MSCFASFPFIRKADLKYYIKTTEYISKISLKSPIWLQKNSFFLSQMNAGRQKKNSITIMENGTLNAWTKQCISRHCSKEKMWHKNSRLPNSGWKLSAKQLLADHNDRPPARHAAYLRHILHHSHGRDSRGTGGHHCLSEPPACFKLCRFIKGIDYARHQFQRLLQLQRTWQVFRCSSHPCWFLVLNARQVKIYSCFFKIYYIHTYT